MRRAPVAPHSAERRERAAIRGGSLGDADNCPMGLKGDSSPTRAAEKSVPEMTPDTIPGLTTCQPIIQSTVDTRHLALLRIDSLQHGPDLSERPGGDNADREVDMDLPGFPKSPGPRLTDTP